MTFEDLEAWKASRQLVKEVYLLTRLAPISRDFGLVDQVQRASVSVMSNIAEGFERTHIAEKMQMYNIARGSLAETRSLCYVVQDNYPSIANALRPVQELIERTGKPLAGLIISTRNRLTPNS